MCPNDSIFPYLCSRVGDHLLSINDISLIGDTVAHAEAVISKLSRGPVRIVATAPPRNVTVQMTSPKGLHLANRMERTAPTSISDLKPFVSPPSEEEGVITVQVSSCAA